MPAIIPTGKKLTLSPDAERLLRDLEIDEDGPGTILKDFRMLLDFVRKGDVLVTRAQQLPLPPLPVLNSRMTHPLKLGLKRTLQKSYPHLNGLYLLLRASGLTAVAARGRKLYLRVDPVAVDSFYGLNNTEQYFTLLETWLLRGWPDIVLEGGRRYSPFPRTFQGWSFLFARIPQNGADPAEDQTVDYFAHRELGWHNVALLELFGLVTIRQAPFEPGRGWTIGHIQRTPLGDALLVLLEGSFFSRFGALMDPEAEELPRRVGAMQPVVQAYFPAWRNNIVFPQADFRKGVHIFRGSLGRFRFRVALRAEDTLEDLARAILSAVRFDSDHLYRFSYRDRFGSLQEVNHHYMEDGPWVHEVQVGGLECPLGQPMTFLFDFGDEWEMEIIPEKVDADRRIDRWEILEAHGEPPEQYPRWEE
jgi:hypothetical protein